MRPALVVALLLAACGVADAPPTTTDAATEIRPDTAVDDDTAPEDTIEDVTLVEVDVEDVTDVQQDERTWRTALPPITESILSIWGSDPTDVWLVGMGGIAIHGGPGGWRQLDLRAVDGSGAGLRGVYGTDGDIVWLVGDEGRVYRWNRMQGRADVVATGTSARLDGVWGVGNQVWVVGGPLSPESGGPVLLEHAVGGFTPVTLPPGLPSDAALTDIWGTSASDVWVAGEKGMLVHWDGLEWSYVALDGAPWLRGGFSRADEVVVVGGASGSELFARSGTEAFARVALGDPNPLNAVAIGNDGEAWAVGSNGRMFQRAVGMDAWEAREPVPGVYWSDVWVDARGDVWVAGQGVTRLGPARADIASGALVRLEDPVVEEDPDVEIVETDTNVDVDTSTIPQPWGFELGLADVSNPASFTPWVNDLTVPIHHGPQGGFHLEVYVRFPLTGSASEVATALSLELFVDGEREGYFTTPSYPIPAISTGLYQTYSMTLAWDCSLSFTCDSSAFDGHTAVVTATVAPPGQSWSGSVRLRLDDTW